MIGKGALFRLIYHRKIIRGLPTDLQVDVMALMAWWDLTIDIISCINLVLCIGLCVDYSAHIGLHFMQVSNSNYCVLQK